MENVFYSLHEFMFHAENMTYVLIVAALVGFPIFWRFLSERDDDNR